VEKPEAARVPELPHDFKRDAVEDDDEVRALGGKDFVERDFLRRAAAGSEFQDVDATRGVTGLPVIRRAVVVQIVRAASLVVRFKGGRKPRRRSTAGQDE
jgi:hypothetical protein